MEVAMLSVGIRELRRQTSELIRMVSEEGRQVEITLRGKPVARLIPIEPETSTPESAQRWANLDRLAAEIGGRWPEGISAVEAVAEGRA
jgi:prevent-host-death family protein